MAAGEDTSTERQTGRSFRIIERRGDVTAKHFSLFVEPQRPSGESCVLTLWHVMGPQWASMFDRTRSGWTMTLDGFASSLKRNPL